MGNLFSERRRERRVNYKVTSSSNYYNYRECDWRSVREYSIIRQHPQTMADEEVSRTTLDVSRTTQDVSRTTEDVSRTTDLADQFSTVVNLNETVVEETPKREHDWDCEDFLLGILNWDPAWLSQEQENSATPPLIVKANLIRKIPSTFKSHENYCRIMETLLALEFWDQILREVEEPKNVIKGEKKLQAPIPCSLESYARGLKNNKESRRYIRGRAVTLEGIVSRKDFNLENYPGCGDLVLIKQESVLGMAKPLQIFGYVEEIKSTEITSVTRYDRNLSRFVDEPHTLLTYSVAVKFAHPYQHIRATEIYFVQKIFYLRSNLRMIEALWNLPDSPLVQHILHPKLEDLKLSTMPESEPRSLVTKDELNVKQLEAVAHVTDTVARDLPKICLIQGPPGTGKSKVIVNLVTEILYNGNELSNNGKVRILVCAPSNTAVDEIVRRLLVVRKQFPESKRFSMIRMGQNESMDSQVAKEVSMRTLVKIALNSATQTLDAYEKKKRLLIAEIKEVEEAHAKHGDKVDTWAKILVEKYADLDLTIQQLRAIWKEVAERKNNAEVSILKKANVIACTLNSSYTRLMESVFGGEKGAKASFCIVDEATQCMEVECLIPLMLGVRTLVLVGDTNQLPATVISQRAKNLGLDQSLFARIQKCFPSKEENPVIQLDTQYRMSAPVALWPNLFFYNGLLQNAAIVQDLPFHYYKVLDHNAKQNKDKFSNTDEAAFVVNVLYTLMVDSQLNGAESPVKVGIITPYNNQKALIHKEIRKCIHPLPENTRSKLTYEVNTVDSFQGQERDVIIMSCVRSSGIGFLSDRHRLCVALTRAKHSVILCGNFKTFQSNSMWRALLSDAKNRGTYLKIEATAKPDEMKQHVFR